jgi:Leucine-rich repeat (LRR) protein
MQLHFKHQRSKIVSSLKLPENLRYLNLGGSELEDYGFIASAKNLESLDLSGSTFYQLDLLLKLPELKHLNVKELTDNDLNVLAGLCKLQYLDLSGSNITTVQPLASLKQLHFLDISRTRITDYQRGIPYFPGMIGLSLPKHEETDEDIDSLPEALQKMILVGRIKREPDPDRPSYYRDYAVNQVKLCLSLEACEVAPWWR